MADYYSILNVSKDSSSDDIKKSYRKLAMKFHPDKGGDENEFKKITEAYEVLSDPEKRKRYDMGGSMNGNPFDMLFGQGRGNPFDMMSNLFGQGRGMKKITKIQVSVSISTLIKGNTTTIEYTKKIKCESCNGTGSKTKHSMICMGCKGIGRRPTMIQMGPGMMMQSEIPCQDCQSTGKKIPVDQRCINCNTTGLQDLGIKKEIFISAGVPAKFPSEPKIIELPGQGDYNVETNTYQDAMVIIQIDPSSMPNMKLAIPEGDIHASIPITLDQVLLGFKAIGITLPSGEIIHLKSEKVIQPDTHFIIPREGLQVEGQPCGNVVITWKVIYPYKLSEYQRKKLKKVFEYSEDEEDDYVTPIEHRVIEVL